MHNYIIGSVSKLKQKKVQNTFPNIEFISHSTNLSQQKRGQVMQLSMDHRVYKIID